MAKTKIVEYRHTVEVPDKGWAGNNYGHALVPEGYRKGNPYTLAADQGIQHHWIADDGRTLCVMPERTITSCVMIEYRTVAPKAKADK